MWPENKPASFIPLFFSSSSPSFHHQHPSFSPVTHVFPRLRLSPGRSGAGAEAWGGRRRASTEVAMTDFSGIKIPPFFYPNLLPPRLPKTRATELPRIYSPRNEPRVFSRWPIGSLSFPNYSPFSLIPSLSLSLSFIFHSILFHSTDTILGGIFLS